jgi:Mg2+-importing ATPase
MGDLPSEISGLSSEEASKRLKKYGYNRVKERSGLADWEILLNQFKNPYTNLLLFTAMLSTFLGEKTDALIIVGIVLTGGLLDFWQERQAYRAVEKLLSMVKVRSSVIRDHKEIEIPAEEIVPEDIVILRAGDMVPAEGVLIKEKDLFVNEALMTG